MIKMQKIEKRLKLIYKMCQFCSTSYGDIENSNHLKRIYIIIVRLELNHYQFKMFYMLFSKKNNNK